MPPQSPEMSHLPRRDYSGNNPSSSPNLSYSGSPHLHRDSPHVRSIRFVYKRDCRGFQVTCQFKKGQARFTIVPSKPVLRIRIRWIRKILASWIRIRKNMRIRIQGAKYYQKLQKKVLLSKPKSELLKKERL